MALTLIKEDGTGKADANSYAAVTDGDAYFEGHLYATSWTAASADNKAKALVFATRLIDAEVQFNGVRASDTQALQWPRTECPDPDRGSADFGVGSAESVVPEDVVPPAIMQATCELGRELLLTDRTAAPPGEGLKYETSGTGQVGYDKSDTRPILSAVVQALLAKYCVLVRRGSAMTRLVRT